MIFAKVIDQFINNERLRARVIYLSLLMTLLIWMGMIVAAPLLRARGYLLLSSLLYQSFSMICHQIPDRCWKLDGLPLGVCARCTGIYAGFLLGISIYPFLRAIENPSLPARRWLVLSVIPMIIDFGGGLIGLFDNTHLSRAVTGAIAGFGAAYYIIPGFVSTFRERKERWPNSITRSPH